MRCRPRLVRNEIISGAVPPNRGPVMLTATSGGPVLIAMR